MTTAHLAIQEVVRLTGVSSRTLRHYDAIGLVPPSSTGDDGRRHYDDAALVRLQLVLVLRTLGVPLRSIGRLLDEDRPAVEVLREHLDRLRAERSRLGRQVASVERTLTALEEGGTLVPTEMFDGFDHGQHREEVERRWGRSAWESSDDWWRSMTESDRADWRARSDELAQDWRRASEEGVAPTDPRAQELARRHRTWLASVPGTPAGDGGDGDESYVLGLADMYVADPRFAAVYGGVPGATLVRDALRHLVAG